MKILIIDNYDSFVFNLYQALGDLLRRSDEVADIKVARNNEISLEQIKQEQFDRIVISPGPGNPSAEKYFGVCAEVIKECGPITPLLGVCLGMQGIGYVFGGKIIMADKPLHGKTSILTHDGEGLFKNLPSDLAVMRYHSLLVEQKSLPPELEITAFTMDENGRKEIMALRHKKFPIVGVQFHPESFATEGGSKILENFLDFKF